MTCGAEAAVRMRLDDEVLYAWLNRPEARNAINTDMVRGLEELLETARKQDVRMVVIRGMGGTFCSGADLHEVRSLIDEPAALRAFLVRLGRVLEDLERAPWVSVAIVDGHAVAGGCELVLSCDIAVASEDAWIGDRHAEYGLAPAAGGSVRLMERVPEAVARYLMFTGGLITGARAADIGLVSIAVEPASLDRESKELIDRLRTRGRSCLRTLKAMVSDTGRPRSDRLRREVDLFLAHATGSPEVVSGLDAFGSRRRAASSRIGAGTAQ